MDIINMHDAQTPLSRLVDKAAKGEPVIIAKVGKPVTQVIAVDAPESGKTRRLGARERCRCRRALTVSANRALPMTVSVE